MHSKTYKKLLTNVDQKKVYTLTEAVSLLKASAGTRTFDETLEFHTRLGIDPSKGEQQVRGTFVMPHAFGKSKRVAAFVTEADEAAAKAAGADLVGGEELVNEISRTEKIDFDVAVATPLMMPKLAKIAKILGPKGLMPNPKTETVGPDIKKLVTESKKGKFAFKNDDTGNVHVGLGKLSMNDQQLIDNLKAFFEVLVRSKPVSSKGVFVKNVYLATTMGPSIKISF